MALETGSFISDLVTSNPPGTDGKDEGDNHLRLLKTVLQGSFPNSTRAFHIPVALAAKTTAYTILKADENSLIQMDASAAVRTATLPAVSGVDDGWTVTVMKSDSSANAVTVDGNGAETINGAATRTLASQYEAETYIRDGSEWKILSTSGIGFQAQDDVLDDIAALSVVADNEFIVGTGAGTYAHESGATARTSMGVAIGTDVQAFGALLDDFNTLGAAAADGEFIVATAAGVFAYESGATLRTSAGLGTGDAAAFASLTLTTDLPITEGGTGNSTAAAAFSALKQAATEAATGVAEIATQAETDTGTDDVRFVTPLKLANATTTGPTQATQAAIEAETNENTYLPPDLVKHNPGVAKMWIKFDVAGTDAASLNVASVDDGGTGNWNVNIATDFLGADYCGTATAFSTGGADFDGRIDSQTAGVLGVVCTAGGLLIDPNTAMFAAAFGDQ